MRTIFRLAKPAFFRYNENFTLEREKRRHFRVVWPFIRPKLCLANTTWVENVWSFIRGFRLIKTGAWKKGIARSRACVHFYFALNRLTDKGLLAKHHKLGTTKDKLESFTVGQSVIKDETIAGKISTMATILYKAFLHSMTEILLTKCRSLIVHFVNEQKILKFLVFPDILKKLPFAPHLPSYEKFSL